MSNRPKKRKPPIEKSEEAWIIKFYRRCGCFVVSYSQPRRTKQTVGIPDLQIFDRRSGTWWYHEVKRQRGPEFYAVDSKQSDDQKEFESLCSEFGIEYLCGARDVAIAKMKSLGRIVS